MIRSIFVFTVLGIIACSPTPPTKNVIESESTIQQITLNLEQAENLISLPLHCIDVEYPNKLGQTLSGPNDLTGPKELHPSFYGCFDWHSAVHGHWSIVYLLKHYPDVDPTGVNLKTLKAHINSQNIKEEVAYFNKKHNKSYERMYGWAWLLKLSEELYTWDHPDAKALYNELLPLTDVIIKGYINYLPKLNYPIRVGTHTNTAFGLTFAWDYANAVNHGQLKDLIEQRAKEFYLTDQSCPITWEPSGHDFLSPCLEEADLMRRILDPNAFNKWLSEFLPQLSDVNYQLTPGIVSDRTDGHLVHLDGVNFSRAWCLYGIANTSDQYDHLKSIAQEHINYSIDDIIGDSYEGGHWLGSFAIYALDAANQ